MTEVTTFLLTVAFAGGGAWLTLKETRRHVNGLGAKVTRQDEARTKEIERIRLAIFALACDKKESALQLLGEK